MPHPYTLTLDGGKYTVTNDSGLLSFLRYGEAWPAAQESLASANVVLALAQRIEELETAIRDVIDGSVDERGERGSDGIRSYGAEAQRPYPLRRWETRLNNVLEQKP